MPLPPANERTRILKSVKNTKMRNLEFVPYQASALRVDEDPGLREITT